MTYTYYAGVMCGGKDCERFIVIEPYETNVRAAVQPMAIPPSGLARTCPYCGEQGVYHSHNIVWSQKEDEMVPLDQ